MSILKEKAQVIMLPTNNKVEGIIYQAPGDILYILNKPTLKIKDRVGYIFNLYILSNEEIKDGDWCYYKPEEVIIKFNESIYGSKYCKKIIATTDTSLRVITFEHFGALPQPSQGFIEKYIKEYNKSNIITDVLVEREHDDTVPFPKTRLKISKDNTITIHPIKTSWSREEIGNKCEEAVQYYIQTGHFPKDKWIEENL